MHATWRKGKSYGWTTVPLGRVLLCFYKLSIVTILLSVMVSLQFAMQILTGVSDQKSPLPVGTGAHLIQTPHKSPRQITNHTMVTSVITGRISFSDAI